MLKEKFALTDQGAKDLKKGIVSLVFADISLMFPIGILVMFLMEQVSPLLGIEVGAILLSQGEIDLFLYLMFLITASRIYDPLSGVTTQIGEIFNAQLQLNV